MAQRLEDVEKKIVFPLSDAIYIALENIRIRARRMGITTLGIVIGIAFMVALLLISESIKVRALEEGVEELSIETYQFWMAGIALVVCMVGVTNSMLMMVTERIREIGTMKCLGARNRHISRLFLIEAFIIGFLGGIVGSIFGVIAAAAFVYMETTPHQIIFTWGATLKWGLFAVLISVVLSVLAAIFPAYRASKLQPADAMRYEG